MAPLLNITPPMCDASDAMITHPNLTLLSNRFISSLWI